MLKDPSLTRPEADVCMSGLNQGRLIKNQIGNMHHSCSSEAVVADLRAACLLDLSRCLCSEACDGMDQQTEAVAEAIPSRGTQVPSRHARYWSLQGTRAVCEVPTKAPGQRITGAGLPEAAKLRPMQVGTGAVLAEAEAGGNAVHEVGK